MRVIKSTPITDAMIVSSDIAEPDAGEVIWAAATAYAVGALAYRPNHRIYRRRVAGTTATVPESDAVNWELAGSTNRWAMFDPEISTQSERASSLTVVLDMGVADSLALANLQGSTAEITVTDGAGGPVVYHRLVDLEASSIYDWYTYFFEPFGQATALVLQDLPPYTNARLTVVITGPGTVACGTLLFGAAYQIGASQLGMAAGIRDYSRKTTDAYGLVTYERRRFAKTLRGQVVLDMGAFNGVHRLLESLLGLVCVWLGDDDGELEPLTAIGFYKDFSLTVNYGTRGYYSLEIEGMT